VKKVTAAIATITGRNGGCAVHQGFLLQDSSLFLPPFPIAGSNVEIQICLERFSREYPVVFPLLVVD